MKISSNHLIRYRFMPKTHTRIIEFTEKNMDNKGNQPMFCDPQPLENIRSPNDC